MVGLSLLKLKGEKVCNLLSHSLLARTVCENIEYNEGVLYIPETMVEHMEVLYLLCDNFTPGKHHPNLINLTELDLVKLVNLCAYMIIPEEYLFYLLRPFDLRHNQTLPIALYWTKYRLNFSKISLLFMNYLGIKPTKLPIHISYRKYKPKIRAIIRISQKIRSQNDLTNICSCPSCLLFSTTSHTNDFITPEHMNFVNMYVTHEFCPVCRTSRNKLNSILNHTNCMSYILHMLSEIKV